MFDINDKQLKRFESDLKQFAKQAYPFATRNTLNATAFQAQREWKHEISQNMVQRNRFTQQSIRVEQTRELKVRHQAAVVGSTAPYMDEQEFGGVKRARGKEGVPIPTSYSAGQGQARPRTRLPRAANKLARIRLRKGKRRIAKTPKQRLIFAVQDAVNSGRREIFLDQDNTAGPRTGIYKVIGGKRGKKRGWPSGAKLKMLYDLSDKAVRIPRNPTLAPAVARARRAIPLIYKSQLIQQLQRRGLFRG